MKKLKYIFILHIFLACYSALGICSKIAAGQDSINFVFLACYGSVLAGLFVYAIVWQQLLKKLPLITAYANKAVTVIWGMVWGHFVFNEDIKFNNIIGVVLIIAGVYLVVSSEEKEDKE